ncbi:EAL domain-containing protein [Dactylosporangium sp. McL0621]|uniref:EAL domain-containing protein n=1 Tax=Dactylosporangium sp. McL0621 TaxID=3415678 RepID=UPI003CF88B23
MPHRRGHRDRGLRQLDGPGRAAGHQGPRGAHRPGRLRHRPLLPGPAAHRPVDVLKVDKSFVDDLAGGGRSVIATALVDVSVHLGLTAIAEGVETAGQADALYRMGYRYGQGYLFGRPEESPAFTEAAALTAAK